MTNGKVEGVGRAEKSNNSPKGSEQGVAGLMLEFQIFPHSIMLDGVAWREIFRIVTQHIS